MVCIECGRKVRHGECEDCGRDYRRLTIKVRQEREKLLRRQESERLRREA